MGGMFERLGRREGERRWLVGLPMSRLEDAERRLVKRVSMPVLEEEGWGRVTPGLVAREALGLGEDEAGRLVGLAETRDG